LLVCILCCLTAVRGASAEQLRTKGKELFCENGQDLLIFVVARNARDSKDRNMPGCSVLGRGLAYTVLENSNPEGKPIVKVRLRRLRGGSIEGYMLTDAE
jgi:hypothetical protein